MSERAAELAAHLEIFNKRLMGFIEELDDRGLDTVIPSVGVPVRTIAAQLSGPRHFGMTHLIEAFLQGSGFPDIDEDEFIEVGRDYLSAQPRWYKETILIALEREGAAAVKTVSSLKDEDLARTVSAGRFGKDITLAEAIDWIVIGASVEALEEMRRAVFTGSPLE